MGWLESLFKGKSRENTDLERIMVEMSKNSELKVRRILYHELLKSTLLLPTPSWLENQAEAKPLKEIQLVTQPGPKGELTWLAFTGRHTLELWKGVQDSPYVALRGKELFALAAQNRVDQILMNPAGPVGGRITRMELEMLAEGTFPTEGGRQTHSVQAREQTPIRIGKPAHDPNPELVEYLRENLSQNTEVTAGYLVAMVIGGGLPHLVLGIQFESVPHRESVKPLMEALGGGARTYLKKDEFLDMVPFDAKHEWFAAIQNYGVAVYKKP